MSMSDDNGYVYSEDELALFKDGFARKRPGLVRSLEKRLTSIRRRFCRYSGRIRARIAEYPLAIAAMGTLPAGSRIAEIGGASSLLGLNLVCLGHEVHVIDLRPCPLKHPKLFSRQVNFFESGLEDSQFDGVTCISVIEHVGIERYNGPRIEGGDFKMMAEISRICRPGGLVVLSAPYGRGHDPTGGVKPRGYRVYNRDRLSRLLAGFSVESLRFFSMTNGAWIEAEQASADLTPTARPPKTVFVARLRVEKGN